MTRQRQILVTVTYNDLGCIIDTKAEPYEEPNLQPTCNNLATDTISRQAAIDALNVLCQEHRYRIPGKRETYSQYNEAWQDALDRAEGAIFNLPSAQSKQLKVLADVLDGCPLTQPCDKMWRGGWCEEHCKNNKLQEPNSECWLKYAEVMASEQKDNSEVET